MRSWIRLGWTGAYVFLLTTRLFAASEISLSSPAFRAGEKIPEKFTCKGANVSPALRFPGVPGEASSLVLVMEDPDAPSGSFTHWIVWNIDPTIRQIAEASSPAGAVRGSNDFGKIGYSGPCPPSGTHRYFFRLFALDQKLDLKSGAKRKDLDKAMAGHILARGELMGRSSR